MSQVPTVGLSGLFNSVTHEELSGVYCKMYVRGNSSEVPCLG